MCLYMTCKDNVPVNFEAIGILLPFFKTVRSRVYLPKKKTKKKKKTTTTTTTKTMENYFWTGHEKQEIVSL